MTGRSTTYAIRYTLYALVPAAVPAWRGAVWTGVSVRAVPVYGRAHYDYWAGAVVVAVAVVLIGEVAACDCHCDYCQYDCRY